jgi:hypothetical protein
MIIVIGVLLLCVILLPACGNVNMATVSPLISPTVFDSPIESERQLHSTLDGHRFVTAAESFPLAQETAKAWRREAEWYGIVPFTSIERAFVIPLDNDNPSWFFRFGVPGGETEYIVEVLNGEVVGTNETKIPGYIEPPLEELEPLGDEWTMMDNVAVLERYLKEEDSLLAQFPYMLVDYRLAKLRGQPHPVWTLYNAQNLAKPIFIMDAITGEALPVE